MDAKTKNQIDAIWKNTDLGKFAIASAEGNIEEANKILLQCQYPYSMDQLDMELSQKIASIVRTESEYDAYLRLLDEENPDLVGFMIADDLLMKVYNFVE